ncbi:MAG: DDE-type integrase/transposase/recombinase [Acidobacteriota bacterium]|nr:MAG: DDE-type integrase/transposase/recombinase [Acidobacteriota bacterium]
MRAKLSKFDTSEIRTAMTGLSGSAAKAEAARLAEIYGVHPNHIYRITRDIRNTADRKTRSDAGRRTYELAKGTGTWFAASLVTARNIDPQLALKTAAAQGFNDLPSLSYFRTILAENGIGAKARRSPKKAHRRVEAKYPGHVFQVDVSALKTRWQDERTRRILRIEGVDKNHPQMDPQILRVWQIMLIDDFSRRRFLRYFIARAITSEQMVRFLAEAYSELGVPQILYTDGGGEFKGRHNDALKILNQLPTIEQTGGYKHLVHEPDRPQATGKVETSHRWAQRIDNLVGVVLDQGRKVEIENLNLMANRAVYDYNENHINRTTGMTPMARWRSKRPVIRLLDPDVVESALLARHFEPVLNADMTIKIDRISYRIEAVAPFVDHIGHKLRVVVPAKIDSMLVCFPQLDGKFGPKNTGEFWVPKVHAAEDSFGQIREIAETSAEQLKKDLKASYKEAMKEVREINKLTGEIAPVPYYDLEPAAAETTGVINFPDNTRIATAAEIDSVVPVLHPDFEADRDQDAPQTTADRPAYMGRELTFWQAVNEYKSRFDNDPAATKEFLDSIYSDRGGTVRSGLIEAELRSRSQPVPLRAVG